MFKYYKYIWLIAIITIEGCSFFTRSDSYTSENIGEFMVDDINFFCEKYDTLTELKIISQIKRDINNPFEFILNLSTYDCVSIAINAVLKDNFKKLNWNNKTISELFKFEHALEPCPKMKNRIVSDLQNFYKSNQSIEALRLINGFILGYYPCPIEYDWNAIEFYLNIRHE